MTSTSTPAARWRGRRTSRGGTRAELRLLHVFSSRPGVAAQVDPAGGTHLDELAAIIRASGVPCEVATIHGDPAFQILQAARDGEADLVVMATHGRTGMSRVVLGSVTEAVLHATPCPLLTIPPARRGRRWIVPPRAVRGGLLAVVPGTLSHALAMVQVASGELTGRERGRPRHRVEVARLRRRRRLRSPDARPVHAGGSGDRAADGRLNPHAKVGIHVGVCQRIVCAPQPRRQQSLHSRRPPARVFRASGVALRLPYEQGEDRRQGRSRGLGEAIHNDSHDAIGESI